MNIFSDFHQTDLYYSLQLLFEKRLGYSLYRPLGLDWYKEGFWKVFPSPDTADQYLGLRQGYQPKDKTLPLNEIREHTDYGDIYICEDKHNNTTNKGITLDNFKKTQFDIVIASIPAHIKPFKELIRLYQPKAKFIFQMGNVFPEVNLNEIPNLMANTLPSNIPSSCNYIQYHQEFNLDIFKPTGFPPEKQIASFINVYHENSGFEDYMTLKSMMPDYVFRSHGGQNQDGAIGTTFEMSSIMQESAWGFHSKRMGDGFGHILYNWYACGKPVITRISDYKGKLGEELLTDMETCINLDSHSLNEVVEIIINMFPEKYQWMTQQAYDRFKEKVDFDKERLLLDKFLDNLI